MTNTDSQISIVIGGIYLYKCDKPEGCKGQRYRVVCFATLVPAYQEVVVVKCLSGPDAGRVIVCSLSNFSFRYEPEPALVEQKPDKVIGVYNSGSGF